MMPKAIVKRMRKTTIKGKIVTPDIVVVEATKGDCQLKSKVRLETIIPKRLT